MEKNEIDLSIITIALKKDFILDCLDSIFSSLKKIKAEVIVIDNNSEDNVGRLVKKRFKKVFVIRTKKRLGFGASNNLGLKKARGRYILFLNDDTRILKKGMFEEMISYLDKEKKIGAVSCALLNPDKETFQGSGGFFPTPLRVFLWMFFLDDLPILKNVKSYHPLHSHSFLFRNEDYFRLSHEQDWITGAFFLTRKEILDKIGGFDEDYFMYVEEVDLCFRMKKEGWKIVYIPKWKIIHFGQGTSGSEFAIINEMKGLKTFYKKHFRKIDYLFLRVVLLIGSIFRVILFFFLGNFSLSKSYVKVLGKI